MHRSTSLFLVIVLIVGVVFAQDTPPSPIPQPCWGADERCSDGQFRDRYGKEQPESCDNDEHGQGAVHTCACNRTHEPEHCDPNGARQYEGPGCSVNCRGNHCHCTNSCDD
jgi:hypothetical protein